MPQGLGKNLYLELSVQDNVDFMARLFGQPAGERRLRIRQLLEATGLAPFADRPAGKLSGGMKQKVGLCGALVHDPQVLIVDEPTAGLDPEERVRFRQLLSELAGERIVILSTHIVSDVGAVATDIALIARGRLVTHATPEALLASVEGKVWERVAPRAELPAIRQRFLVTSTAHRSDGVHLRIVAEEKPGPDAAPLSPTLEDAYLCAIAAARNGAAA